MLESARTRDVNESDTAVIVSDFLTDVLGYDKYEDVTTEFAVRSTFCDLAVKRGGHVQYLIEVKPLAPISAKTISTRRWATGRVKALSGCSSPTG